MNVAYSAIEYKKLHEGLDFDPEHYHPDRLIAWKQISKKFNRTVSDIFDEVIDIQDADSKSEVFDLTDALGCFLSRDGKRSSFSSKKVARYNDVIVSRLRSYLREVCVVPNRSKDFKPYLSTEFLVFRSKSSDGAWLLPFLLCEKVQTILQWAQTGNNHPRFHASTILNLPIPDSVLAIKDTLSEIVSSAIKTYEKSLGSYPEAVNELTERIGWDKLCKSEPELFYQEEFRNISNHNRIDAEYFQPQYKRLQERLLKIGAKPIGAFSPEPQRGVQPLFCDNGEVVVIDSKSVRPLEVETSESDRISLDFFRSQFAEKGRVKKNDVLLNSTGVGTLGRASFYNSEQPALADNHVSILRPNKDICLPAYLSLFLNSSAGLAQSEMLQTGSSGQVEIYPQHIQQILVYLPATNGKIDLKWQQNLADKVLVAVQARKEAQALLKKAKILVESAIQK